MKALGLSFVAVMALAPALGGVLPPTRYPVQTLAAPLEELIAEKDPACTPLDEEDAISQDGRKAAWRAPAGRKWSVMLNGVQQGPVYDEVRSLSFSPDGRHLAYAAKRGKRWVIVEDGKEGVMTYADVGVPRYSEDGSRIAFAAKPEKKWVLVVDGQTQGSGFDAIGVRTFSPDGQRVAYVGARGGKSIVVVDGKEGPPFDVIAGLGFSTDSRRFTYAGADVHQGFGSQKATGRVVIDGIAGPEFEGAPVGGFLANAVSGYTPRLLLGYFPLVRSGTHGVSAPAFSPDGKRVAYAAHRGKDNAAVILDGEAGSAFAAIVAGPVFSPDSQHVAYIVSEGGASILVVDGSTVVRASAVETDLFTDLTFAPDNRRVAYVGVNGGINYEQQLTVRARRRVYVDGVAGSEYNVPFLGWLQFTPDGTHLAYVVGGLPAESGKVGFVVVDGVEGKRYDDIFGRVRVDGDAFSYTVQVGRKFYAVTQPLDARQTR